MGVKISNDISSESTHQIHSQKIMHTPGEGLPKLLKELYWDILGCWASKWLLKCQPFICKVVIFDKAKEPFQYYWFKDGTDNLKLG